MIDDNLQTLIDGSTMVEAPRKLTEVRYPYFEASHGHNEDRKEIDYLRELKAAKAPKNRVFEYPEK